MLDASGIEIIILDFDGVIVESNNIKDLAFEKIFDRFSEHKVDLWEYHKKNISIPRHVKFDFLLEKTGRINDTNFKNQLLAEFSNLTLELMRSVTFVKGAKDFLNEMHQKMPIYLVSVTPINDLEIILDQLQIRSFFKGVYGCPPWNKPKAIRDILLKEHKSPLHTVLIGDTDGDQRAAKETGIHFVARNSGLDFEEPYPSFIIPDLSGLSTFFKPA